MRLIKDQNGHSDLETGIRRSGKFVVSSHHATIDEALLDNELLHVSFLSLKQCFITYEDQKETRLTRRSSSYQIIEALRIEPVFGYLLFVKGMPKCQNHLQDLHRD
ncbi:hypothetical protein Tco_0987313 [Tanacetum coccineum]